MLEVVKRKQDLVEKTYRRDGSLFLETQKGLLRLKPRNDSIVRISYTQKGEFTGNIGIGILEEKEWDGWTCEEQESRVVLYTEKLALEVDRGRAVSVIWKGTGGCFWRSGKRTAGSWRNLILIKR